MEKDFIPKSISHRNLDRFLKSAKKEKGDFFNVNQLESKEINNFNNLLKAWSESSQELISMLKDRESPIIKDRSSKSLMALGAMEVHINMAMQALKASEFEK